MYEDERSQQTAFRYDYFQYEGSLLRKACRKSRTDEFDKMRKKRYIITDSCFFYDNKKKRSHHWIEAVDLETGEVVSIKSGSIIQIVKRKK